MRNSADAARLTSPRFRERIALALAAGSPRSSTVIPEDLLSHR